MTVRFRALTYPAVVLLAAAVVTGCGDGADSVATSSDDARPEDDPLVVTCTHDKTAVNRTRVMAGAGGVDVRMVDRTGEGLQLRSEPEDQQFGSVSTSAGEWTLNLPPGRNLLLCSTLDGPEHMLAPSDTDEAVALDVEVDPELWKTPVIDCSLVSSMIVDFAAEPGSSATRPSNPVEAVRVWFPWLTERDKIEKAGYLDGEEPIQYRVLRENEGVVAVASLSPSNSGWVVWGSEVCSDVEAPSS